MDSEEFNYREAKVSFPQTFKILEFWIQNSPHIFFIPPKKDFEEFTPKPQDEMDQEDNKDK